jgi:hypothetical protein
MIVLELCAPHGGLPSTRSPRGLSYSMYLGRGDVFIVGLK